MTPYYSDDWVTIYHGDCREVLPSLPKVDLVLSDPPYGIKLDTNFANKHTGKGSSPAQEWDAPVYGDDVDFDPGLLLSLETNLILWGGNCFSSKLPDFSGWLSWLKTARNEAKIRQADMELAWTNCIRRSQTFRHLWIGAFKASESGERNRHPTQKPVALMRWCLTIAPKHETICDPYMGSGSTLRAAKDLNRKAIGIEIEEKYCEVAATRMAQEVFDFTQ